MIFESFLMRAENLFRLSVFGHEGLVLCEVVVIDADSGLVLYTGAEVYGHIFSYADLAACRNIVKPA